MWAASAFRFSPSIVAVLDAANGCVVDVNPAFEQVLGIPRQEALGRRTVDLGIWSSVETRGSIWMRIRSPQRVCGDIVGMHARDGREIRRHLGIPWEPDSPGFVVPDGVAIPAADLRRWLRTAKLVRMGLEVNGGICRSLLRAHRGVEIEDPEEGL